MKSTTVIGITVAIVGVICCVVAACGLSIAFSLLSSQADSFNLGGSSQIGQAAPDFELKAMDGEAVSLQDFRGQPVMLNFWALWCSPCIEEMPIIQERYKQHNPNIVVLAIEEGSSIASVGNYVHESQFSFLVLQGTEAVGQQFNIRAYPTSVFIDADGVIRSIVIGGLTGPDLDAELAKIGVGD